MSGPLRDTWIVWIVAAGIALVGCNKQKVDDGPPKPVIAVSIFPVASLVGQLTDGWADVVTLLPDGASEHAFELTADQVRQLSHADLLVLVGNGLDAWAEPKPGMTADSKQPTVLRMGDLIGNLGEGKDLIAPGASKIDTSKTNTSKHDAAKSDVATADASKADAPKSPPPIPLPAPDPNLERDVARRGPPPAPVPDAAGPNNHLWLDPVLAGRFVSVLASQLSARYPHRRGEIEQAATRLSAELQELDQKYRLELSMVRRRELVTFHNAFDLIAHRYGLIVVARLTDIESDPHGGITPASYLAAIKAIRQYRLMAIYSEPEFSAQEIGGIQRETAVEVLTLDPLGGPSIEGYRTYQQMMLSNLKTLVNGQGLETMALPEFQSMPKPTGGSPSKNIDPELDAPLKVPGAKPPKAKQHPHFLSDPDAPFPHTVPKSAVPTSPDPFAPTPNPAPASHRSPFQP
jgi:ABC-type Zn uptake system ZnuABC Zn-binding protein ZnuA